MRISSLFIVFQGTSIFMPTFAAYTTSHTDSHEKEFICNNRIIGAEEFSKPPQERITELMVDGRRVSLTDKFNELLHSAEDSRVVMYNNGWGNTNTLQEHILVIDEVGRVCAMMLKLTVRETMWGPASAPIVHLSLCMINV
ncbi:CSEP0263 putative effector protein [Blumeria hordei DH14]|uniref:CSEP0263 putative effector protein n=1 Tax=Blumeria graminis f. sp. hordei (strain DH14) TaxID=546991 RepID=N1J8E3_BLUG1|nr:CSEP0263 putative effector protein [Blumeria hordei DH14]